MAKQLLAAHPGTKFIVPEELSVKFSDIEKQLSIVSEKIRSNLSGDAIMQEEIKKLVQSKRAKFIAISKCPFRVDTTIEEQLIVGIEEDLSLSLFKSRLIKLDDHNDYSRSFTDKLKADNLFPIREFIESNLLRAEHFSDLLNKLLDFIESLVNPKMTLQAITSCSCQHN